MLLTITTTHQPATDLGYLLHKNPGRCQSFELAFGMAHVFYPEASDSRCTVALLLEVDPVGLVRRQGKTLREYVNDRPYAASSFLSVAISRVFGTAMRGKSKERPWLAETPLPLNARISVLPCREGAGFLKRLFEPLGYAVRVWPYPLDEEFPEWGESRYFTVELTGEVRLPDLLSHLYVLVPILDDDKHYWVGEDEVDKLLRRGREWLAGPDPRSPHLCKRWKPPPLRAETSAHCWGVTNSAGKTSSTTWMRTGAASGRYVPWTTSGSRLSTCWPQKERFTQTKTMAGT